VAILNLAPRGASPIEIPAPGAAVGAEGKLPGVTVGGADPGAGGDERSSRAPQCLHLMATALISSPQKGQSLVPFIEELSDEPYDTRFVVRREADFFYQLPPSSYACHQGGRTNSA